MWQRPTPRRFPLSICCVLEDTFYTDSRISDIRAYAYSVGASFTMREYDSYKFSADKKYVERLPAFHVYIDKSRNRTFYLDSEIKPEEQINECSKLCLEREERKKLSFIEWIKSLFHKSHGRNRSVFRTSLK